MPGMDRVEWNGPERFFLSIFKWLRETIIRIRGVSKEPVFGLKK
jgi:hypothetical protein